MTKTQTVKARIHHGSKSLDLTIPSKICKEYQVKDGDVFTIDIETVNNNLILRYKRIFKQ